MTDGYFYVGVCVGILLVMFCFILNNFLSHYDTQCPELGYHSPNTFLEQEGLVTYVNCSDGSPVMFWGDCVECKDNNVSK